MYANHWIALGIMEALREVQVVQLIPVLLGCAASRGLQGCLYGRLIVHNRMVRMTLHRAF